MPIVHPADAVGYEMHGSRFLSFVTPSRGSRDVCAWRLELPASLRGVAHTPTGEEVLVVLEGELRVSLDGIEHGLGVGDVALIPPGETLRIDAGPDGAAAWVVCRPGLQAITADGSWLAPPWAC